MKPQLIGIMGLAGSGKSTIATYLSKRYRYQVMKFSGVLKDMLRALGMSEAEIEGDLKESHRQWLGGKTPRHVMLTLGTEWGRDLVHRDMWVNALFRQQAFSLPRVRDRIVIDDCRFQNEATEILSHGGSLWRVRRDLKHPACFSGHVSEAGQQGVEVQRTLQNNGSIQDLHNTIDALLQ